MESFFLAAPTHQLSSPGNATFILHLLDHLGNHLQMLDVKFAQSLTNVKARIWPAPCGPSGLFAMIRDRQRSAAVISAATVPSPHCRNSAPLFQNGH